MQIVKGVQKLPNGKYRVQKYGCHIGVYDTIEEAEFYALDAEIERGLLSVKSITPSGVKIGSH